MHRALMLATRARGYVEPNPVVGAVVVRNGKIVGEGYHRQFGGPHAEVFALRAAGRKAAGATLYVTLEPCCHFGKTPPCTDAILASDLSRVVVAMTDPFPQVRGRGTRILRAAGIQVDVGLLEEDARIVNAPFIKRVTTGKPYVIAKWAQSLNGAMALPGGGWISSDESRAVVQRLRGRMDAIVIGIGTALADDPLLIARPARVSDVKRIATRIILDTHCRLPVDSQLVRTIARAPVLIAHAAKLNAAAESRRRRLADRGVITLALPTDRAGRPRLAALLLHLGQLDYANVLLECGPRLLAAFLAAGEIDEAHIHLAPMLSPAGPASLGAFASRLRIDSVQRVGPDLHIVARPKGA